jgi:hypothetical protein
MSMFVGASCPNAALPLECMLWAAVGVLLDTQCQKPCPNLPCFDLGSAPRPMWAGCSSSFAISLQALT